MWALVFIAIISYPLTFIPCFCIATTLDYKAILYKYAVRYCRRECTENFKKQTIAFYSDSDKN